MNVKSATISPVANLHDLAEGSITMAKVDGRRICLATTADGVHALDHACPHEGYGLTQGSLDGDLLTCAWHNWKFRVTDGRCVIGEEDVQTHDVEVDDQGDVRVTLRRPQPEVLRERATASLRRGIEKDYVGQIARDCVRLLQAGAEPSELMAVGVAHAAPRGEYGWGHDIAAATDCLAMVDLYSGEQRALPVVQGLAGIAETARDRPVRPVADPLRGNSGIDAEHFRAAVEAESVTDAQAILRAALRRGDDPRDLASWFTQVVSDHHLSYGHGAIYSQKAFELLAMIGWDRADAVLSHLVPTIVFATREDALPYMRPFMKAVAGIDLESLASIDPDPSWSDDGSLQAALLGPDRPGSVAAVADAFRSGAGVHGVLDTAVDAVAVRMLRYDTDGEFDFADDFGWFDITHGITYAHAIRWHHERSSAAGNAPTDDIVRLTFFGAFLALWTGRHEWHTSVGPTALVEPICQDVAEYGDELQRRSLADGTSRFIVHAHAVKTSRAAALEALRRDTTTPLDAVARFLEAPKLERFVAATVHRSIDVLTGRTQRN
jgi:nitrite reductase/ring-hydroxylating ferredoxin subunit